MKSVNLHPFVLRSLLFGMISFLVACTQTKETTEITGADPGVLEAPIAFAKRPIPRDENGDDIQPDLREPLLFSAGGDVFIRSNSTATAVETNITTEITGGQGDVRDLSPSFNGSKLLFSLRLFDENENDDEVPSWNIYEYDLENQALRCIIDSDPSTAICDGLIAEQGDDIGPAYLPDGRIVFSSNRQKEAGQMLTDERKPRFRALDEDEDTMALVLHVMDDDGSDIQQISFNQSHDLDPTVLTNGKVAFTRWDNAAGNNAMHLYQINPDGSDLQVLYGVHSHNSGSNNDSLYNGGDSDATIQFSQPVEMEDGRLMAIARPYSGTFGGGDLITINSRDFTNNEQPVYSLSGMPGQAQQRATINPVSSAAEISLGGRYRSAWPLWDGSNRVLISKSSCVLSVDDGTETLQRPCIEPYLSQTDIEEVSPAYSIWLYDMNNDAQKVIVLAEQGKVMSDIVALQARATPPIIDGGLNAIWQEEGLGALHIRSVYDFGNGNFNGCFLSECTDASGINSVQDLANPALANADQRPARFVRFVKAVALPDEDDPALEDVAPDLDREAFGPQRNQAMREIVGYAPVEPDGSVKVKLPANIPLAINILDKNGQRIGARHQNWFQLVPGETLECNGCHTVQNGVTPLPHQRKDAETPSINSGISGTTVPNTLNPDTGEVYLGNIGETLAELRFRQATSEPHVGVDIEYEDVWTDPNVRSPDAPFSYRYSELQSPSPSTQSCLPESAWDFKCRILINYPDHIQPLWDIPRSVNINSVDTDVTCTGCHSPTDAADVARVPAGQLNLTLTLDTEDNSQRVKSYLELFNTDQGQELDEDGNIVNRQIEQPVLDENGDPLFETDAEGNLVLDPVTGQPIPVIELVDDPNFRFNPVMSGNGGRASYFFSKMTDPTATRASSVPPNDANYVDHSAFMSKDELRLISEWLDIGAQYYNDPFDPAVPMN